MPKSIDLEFEPLPGIPVTQTDANLPLKMKNGDTWKEYKKVDNGDFKTFLLSLIKSRRWQRTICLNFSAPLFFFV